MPTKTSSRKPTLSKRATSPSSSNGTKPARGGKTPKYVYTWGNNKADGDGSMKALLGGKGANLAEMTRIGLPVPPGFTITTEVCTYYYAHKKQ
jgi:pyruvate,orthophosphate dikinase